VLWGSLLGLASAVAYTCANIFLRAASDCDPLLVSSAKALPTVLCTAPWLALAYFRGWRVFPRRSVLVPLAAAGLFAHFAGNVLFQWSLGIVGIALTVPLCLGTIICGSALLGRVVLLEPVTRRTLAALVLLVVAIFCLSGSAGQASQAISSEQVTPLWVALGVAAACISGFAYAILGMAIRWAVLRESSVAATTFTVAIVGLVSLSATTYFKLGWEAMTAVESQQWLMMLLAGVCNVIAFLALTRALQLTTLVYVNALNASQVAIASTAGILLFGEAASTGLAAGVGLTILGLLVMPRHKSRRIEPETSQKAGSKQALAANAAASVGTPGAMAQTESTARRALPDRKLLSRRSSSPNLADSQPENSASDVESSITPT